MVQRLEQGRTASVANQMLAQQRDQTLLHQRLGHGLGAQTWGGDFSEHELESGAEHGVRRTILDHGLAEETEQYDAEIAPHTNKISA